jgi:hypothetical protein
MLDGEELPGKLVPLVDLAGSHDVLVRMASSASQVGGREQ